MPSSAQKLTMTWFFGPAYKGILLAATTVVALSDEYGKSIPYCFNRKEAKNHGEGGTLVGAPLKGRVLIIDDVITAGTAIREVMETLTAQNTLPVAVVVGLDRKEKGCGGISAIQEVEAEFGISVVSIVSIDDIIEYLSRDPMKENVVRQIENYRANYGVWSMYMSRQFISQYKFWLLLLMVASLLAPVLVEADLLYRYRNSEGVVVINNTVPAEYVTNGYDILSSNGQLLDRVHALEEGVDIKGAREAGIMAALQEDEDNFLLRSYSSVSEIEIARDRKLTLLDRAVESTESDIEIILQLRHDIQSSVADQQRAGLEVSRNLLNRLSESLRHEQNAMVLLESRRARYDLAEQRFINYIKRYNELSQSR